MRLKKQRIDALTPHPLNYNPHDSEQVNELAESLKNYDQYKPIVVWRDPDSKELYIIAGHGLWLAAKSRGDKSIIVNDRSDLDRQEAMALMAADNLTASTDFVFENLEILLENFDEPLEIPGVDVDLLSLLDFDLPVNDNDEQVDELLPSLTRSDVPDALWPSNNDWGIPLLDINLQATALALPVSLWGAVKRKSQMLGTWVFYCDDYRFEALWRDPSGIVNTRCVNVAEPNFTVGPQMPRAVALWQIYRKRWLARWWQSHGLRILVDVNIDFSTFGDIALLGVPEGWKAYITRGYTERIDYTMLEYKEACKRANTDSILFVLYGGGRACKDLARQQGWVWIPEHMDMKRGGVVKDG